MRDFSEYRGYEVSGLSVVGFVNGFAAFKSLATTFLTRENIGTLDREGTIVIEPQGWYPLDGYLRAFNAIARETGESVVRQLGMGVMQNVHWPKEANSLEGMVRLINVGYHMHHRRNGVPLYDAVKGPTPSAIGSYEGRKVSDSVFVLECANPYPCLFDQGIVHGGLRRLGVKPGAVTVTHEASRPCRAKAGKSCTLRLELGPGAEWGIRAGDSTTLRTRV
jgi:hypothetical protein